MKILLIDDHALLRTGVRSLLERHLPLASVEEAETLGAALLLIRAGAEIGLVVLDLGLPDSQGYEALTRLRAELPSAPVIVLSGLVDPAHEREARRHGAVGFVRKNGDVMALLRAIEALAEDGLLPASEPGWRSGGLPGLSARQQEILTLCQEQLSNKEIGRRLGISDNTVRSHLAMLFRRFGVTNRAALAALAAPRPYPLAQPASSASSAT